MERRVKVGRILGPHGVRGQAKVQSFLSEPEAIGTLEGLTDDTGRPVRLRIEGASGQAFIAGIDGVTRRQAVAKTDLYVPRAALPETEEGEYYEADLKGLAVVDETGAALGVVEAVADFGAGPLIEVKPMAGGATVFLPFTETVVPEVDVTEGRIRVALVPGLWPDR